MTCICYDPVVFGHHCEVNPAARQAAEITRKARELIRNPRNTRGNPPEPDRIGPDLLNHLYSTLHSTVDSRYGHWVMNREWFNEIRRLYSPSGRYLYQPSYVVGAPDTLFGLTIEIRADGGPPHLEPDGDWPTGSGYPPRPATPPTYPAAHPPAPAADPRQPAQPGPPPRSETPDGYPRPASSSQPPPATHPSSSQP